MEKRNVKVAVIRLRGTTGIQKDVALALKLLNLDHINNCVIVEETPTIQGMLSKVKDYITWGEISPETLKALSGASSGKAGRTFRLKPARGGLGRRGIKAPFSRSGALGYRKDSINELIMKMI